ncbi:voltage-dependent calcium channel subunit alpha-2/delta-3 [Hydra vulgaris]|uniref:Voltage-dependent calcium channel subunit alpha-2/delta-3 n=1 Tax=Hydra vulgaris TaxID=6087 RepID=A0ABM4BS08_HYDVU
MKCIHLCVGVISMMGIACNQSSTTFSLLTEAAKTFSKTLDEYLNKVTNYKALNEELNMFAKNVEFRKRNGKEISDKFNARIKSFFSGKEKILKNLHKNITEIKKTYKYDSHIAEFNYPNVRAIIEVESQLNVSFQQVVNKFPTDDLINDTLSYVHVPMSVDERSKEILNAVKWTQNLDKIFKYNMNIDSSLYFQYYCDVSGLFRIFPGEISFMKQNRSDLYDCRRRVWYQQSVSSSKDVVIVIDRSGSMTGISFSIAKIAARMIIDALGENDYFNVITVSNGAKLIEPCVPYLIQATKFNKEKMQIAINKIEKPNNVLNLTNGILLAFNILNSAVGGNNRTYRVSCNKLIIVISDGLEGNYNNAGKVVFERMNSEKNVRVFSYLVGRVTANDRALKEMSCNNRGYFYKIETLGNIWDSVVGYLEVLSRSLASHKDEIKPTLSPVYLDSSGKNMVLTMSLGVFNDKKISGVVGIDILLSIFKLAVPEYELGLFSHLVIINENGFVVEHPKFRSQHGYLPSPINVLLENLEYSVNKNDSILLKEKMLQGKNESMQFPIFWLYDDDRKIMITNVTHYFNPIYYSEISASYAISETDVSYYKVNRSTVNPLFKLGVNALYVDPPESATNSSLYSTFVDIPNWLFCDQLIISKSKRMYNETKDNVKNFLSVADLHSFLSVYEKIEDINDRCNEELISNLLVTAAIVHKYVNESCQFHQTGSVKKNTLFESLYVSTAGGYTRYITINKTVTKPDLNRLRISSFEDAMSFPNLDIIVSAPVQYGLVKKFIHIKASSWIKRNDEKVLMAITGTEINFELFKEMFDNAIKSIGINCKTNTTTTCAIIDQNGYILISNLGDDSIGTFFGKYQGNLMSYLSTPNVSIFKKIELEDTQAVCPEPKTYSSTSNILFTPAKMLFTFLGWIFYLSWRVLNYAFVFVVALLQESTVKNQAFVRSGFISCSKIVSFYLFQNEKWNEVYSNISNQNKTSLRFECAPSKYIYFVLAVIPKTNLIFINVDVPSDIKCRKETLELLKEKDQTASFCAQEETFRASPSVCYNENFIYEEQPEFCGDACFPHQSCALFILSTVIFFIKFAF